MSAVTGVEVQTSVVTLNNVSRFIAARGITGLIKLVEDAQTDMLIGGSFLAPKAGNIIQTVVMVLKGGLTTRELGDTISPYLAAMEG